MNCLTELTRRLPELLFSKAKTFLAKLQAYNQMIALAPLNVQQFVQFNENVV